MNKILIIITVSSILAVGFMQRQSVHKIDNLKEENRIQFVQIENKYNKIIQSYKEYQQKNNIVKTITVYKPSGEKTVTRLVNRSVILKKETKKAAEMGFYRLDSSMEGSVKEEEKEIMKSSSSLHYIVGVTVLQPLSKNLADYSLTGGMRIFSTPFFLTTSIPMITDFYKKTAIGISISF